MVIKHNISALNTQRYLKANTTKINKDLEKLSSGYRINRAADDAAGLAVSEKLMMQKIENERCMTNVTEGLNLAKTADGALAEVNDMLCRVQELCVQATNGTYDDFDREILLQEVKDVYNEMERIFETSRFNDILLFRHTSDKLVNGYIDYLEDVNRLDTLVHWGELTQVVSRPFDLAEPAKGASVTMQLDADVDVADASTLDGKSFQLQIDGINYLYQFDANSSSTSYQTYDSDLGCYIRKVGINDCTTVQDAFDKLTAKVNPSDPYRLEGDFRFDQSRTTVNADDGTVTIAFQPTDLIYEIYTMEGAEGTDTDNIPVLSVERAKLNQVDGSDVTNNTITYGKATSTITLLPGKPGGEKLDEKDREALLNGNELNVAGQTIKFADSAGANTVNLRTINTVEELRIAIQNAVRQLPLEQVDATLSGDSLTVTYTPTSSDGNKIISESASIYETLATTSGPTQTAELNKQISISATGTPPATIEIPSTATVTITPSPPSPLPSPRVFAFTIDTGISYPPRTCIFYDSSLLPEDHVPKGYSYDWDTNGKTDEEIYERIRYYIDSCYSSDKITVTRSDNEITVESKDAQIWVHELEVKSHTGTFEHALRATGTPVLLQPQSSSYFNQEYSLPLDLTVATQGNPDNIANLAGSGFKVDDTWYEFTDGSSTIRPGAKNINISGCATYADVMDAMTAVMNPPVTITPKTTQGQLDISGTYYPMTYSGVTFRDGLDGIDGVFSDSADVRETTSGGEDATQPSTTVDFSDYNASNFHELYGRGFRVTCATCEDEYFNVIFCNNKSELDIPESFEIIDSTGVPRTIYNYAVELKDMTSGEDIVRNIVDQLKPNLNHYTDVAVGHPASTLVVMDKRPGDVIENGQHYRAQILTGVYTNFTYDVESEYVPFEDTDVVTELNIGYAAVDIYVGSQPEHQYIPIHLPYLTLKNLNLNPPEPDFSTPESCADTLERAITANQVIVSARTTIGADHNRLEHAYASLSVSAEEANFSYSVIRDTDMAEQMTSSIKNDIINQSAQAMLAQANHLPQDVLQLLR